MISSCRPPPLSQRCDLSYVYVTTVTRSRPGTSPHQTKHTICQHQQETMRSNLPENPTLRVDIAEKYQLWENQHSFQTILYNSHHSKGVDNFYFQPPLSPINPIIRCLVCDHNGSSPSHHPIILMLTSTSNIPDQTVSIFIPCPIFSELIYPVYQIYIPKLLLH